MIKWLMFLISVMLLCFCFGIASGAYMERRRVEQPPEGALFKKCAGVGYSYEPVAHTTFDYVQRFIIQRKTKPWERKQYDTLLTDELWEDHEKFFCGYYRRRRNIAYSKSLYQVWQVQDTGVRSNKPKKLEGEI